MSTSAPFWDADREQQLRKLWETGMSCRNIAEQIGANRNMVIGKAHRLGLPGRASPLITGSSSRHIPVSRSTPDELRERSNERQRQKRAASRESREIPTPRQPPTRELKVAPMSDPVERVSLEEAQRRRGCRFPYGDRPHMTFCGKTMVAATAERPDPPWFCAQHDQSAHSASMGSSRAAVGARE